MNRDGRHARSRCVAALCLALAGWATAIAAQPSAGAAAVKVAVAKERQMSRTLWVPGTVVSRNDARLAAEIPGRLEWIAEIGDVIRAGQPVARLDDHLLDLMVQQDDIKIRRLEVNLKYLEQEVHRIQSLTDQQITARNQLDALMNQRLTAEQDLEEAKVVRQQNRHRLASCNVLAPFSGQVVERLMQPGEYTNTGLPIVRLVDVSHAEVKASAPLDVAPHLSQGQTVTLEDDDQQTLDSRVRTAVPVGDERSRMFEVRVTLPENHPWVIGAALRLALPNSASQQVVAVPRDALVLRQGETYLFKVEDGGEEGTTVRRIDVSTGVGEGSWIEVGGDLATGDRVVVRGAERLQDGQTVTVRD